MKRHFSDHLEKQLADALEAAGIRFVHESEHGNDNKGIDFYLPAQGVYIEVKQYHAPRIAAQMERQEEVIAIQGKKSLDFFCRLIKAKAK